MIDTLRPVSLPEGVEITLRLAGPVARARAWLIDFGLRGAITLALPAAFSWMGRAGMGALWISIFLLWELYPVFFEVLWDGATPGKRACNLAVVHGDGTPVGWPASFLRNVMRWADMLPVGYAVGLTAMLLDAQFRRLGDLAAGTVVVHRDPKNPRIAPRAAAPAPRLAPVAPAISLTPLEQRAVLEYAERRPGWSPERAAELAEVAAPLLQGLTGGEAVARLEAVAAGLVERR
ncbi:MAG TPA: RDD family protein [Usitatibacter sp.]|nr:RDD family protein [Usitatibacter sp.]